MALSPTQNGAYTCSSRGVQLDREPSSQPSTIIAVPAHHIHRSCLLARALMQHKQTSEQQVKALAWAAPTCHLNPGPFQDG